jgi:hypothetical protein
MLALLASCASQAATQRSSEARSSADRSKEQRILVASIRSEAPDQPFVDLGPIVLRDVHTKEDLHARLQLEADRLLADGFILEGRGMDSPRVRSWGRDTWGAVLSGLVDLAFGGEPSASSPVGESRDYVRAYRLAPSPIPAGTLAADAPEAVRIRIAEISTLGGQIEYLVELLLAGEIQLGEFERMREELCRTSRES